MVTSRKQLFSVFPEQFPYFLSCYDRAGRRRFEAGSKISIPGWPMYCVKHALTFRSALRAFLLRLFTLRRSGCAQTEYLS